MSAAAPAAARRARVLRPARPATFGDRWPGRQAAGALALLALAVLACCGAGADAGSRSAPAPEPEHGGRPSELLVVALPGARHGHRIERVEGGLLSFGGFGDASAPEREMRQTWWLAPGATEWERRADMSAPRAFFGSALVDGAAHAIGAGVERYDLGTDRWIEVAGPGSIPRSHLAAAAIGHELFVLGGFEPSPGALLVVDARTGELREEPPPPGYAAGDHFHCVHVLGGRLHVLGGLDGERFEPRAEHWVRTDAGWKELRRPPLAFWAKFTVQAARGDDLLLFEERGGWRFRASEDEWIPRATVPEPLVMAQAFVLGRTMWVLGGVPLSGAQERRIARYDLDSDRWLE